MQTSDYSIGIVTYLGRYETYFQPFMRELVAIFPDREIVVFVNGHYDIVQQTAYLKKVTSFLGMFSNVRYVTHLEHQSLALGWNHLVWMSHHPRVLICNDDLRVDPVFRQHMERGLAEYPDFFVINRSWSHFMIAKDIIRKVGWFDERFKGVGYEDGDYMVRMITAQCPLVSIPCAGVKNIVADQANAGWATQSKVTRGKYSLINEDFFRDKYESNFTGREDRSDDVYAIRFQWNGETLKATLRGGMATPEFYPLSILGDTITPIPAPAGMRIIGLVPGRNESQRLAFCLRALARYTDAIVYLDDFSEDDSVKVVESLAAECRVERILRKDRWYRDEPGDRNRLLDAGREIGGTHFIAVDADEAFTANCANGDYLRRLILALQPGDQLTVNWIQLWRDVGQFRFDDSVWTWNYKGVIFCDDGLCRHYSDFIHTPRVPANLSGQVHRLSGYAHGLMHFQFVNWRNLMVKQAWYRCLEHIRDPQKTVAAINERYAASKDERGLRLRIAPLEWLTGYPFFDVTMVNESESWREKQIHQWFNQYGQSHFKNLDIWDLDWAATPAALKNTVSMPAPAAADLTVYAVAFITEAEKCKASGNLRGAGLALLKALDWAPNMVDLILATAVVHLQLGYARAARWLSIQATLLKPNHPQAHVRLAEAALALGLQSERDSALDRAVELAPCDPAVLAVLGNTWMAREEFAEAVACFRRVLEQAPSDIPTLLRLGVCHFKTGDIKSTLATYAEVLRLEPGHKIAQENIEFLSHQPVPAAAGSGAS